MVMGSPLIMNPFIAIYAFSNVSLSMNVIQQYLAKDNFLTGSDKLMVWKPYNFPTY